RRISAAAGAIVSRAAPPGRLISSTLPVRAKERSGTRGAETASAPWWPEPERARGHGRAAGGRGPARVRVEHTGLAAARRGRGRVGDHQADRPYRRRGHGAGLG